MNERDRSGGVLIAMALFFAFVGILFGLGRLKLYEYQVDRRIERQYQLEKTIAARSALSYLVHEASPGDAFRATFPVFRGITYRTSTGNQSLICDMIPTPPVDRQEFENLTGWKKYTFNNLVKIDPVPDADTKGKLSFDVKSPTNHIYKAAVYKKAEHYWLETDFGLMYRVCMLKDYKGFGKLRLYLVGTRNIDPASLTLDDAAYTNFIASSPFIMMETIENPNKEGFSMRSMWISDGIDRTVLEPSPSIMEESDDLTHPGGFLLSATGLVCLGADGAGSFFRSVRHDIGNRIDTNDFRNALIVVEHEFATNALGRMTVNIDFLEIREPTTYHVSVSNKMTSVTDDTDFRISTMTFMTEYPVKPLRGRSCYLDIFGNEPSSLKKERTQTQ